MTLVDVLIPTFRRQPALAATLATLVAQTHPDFRIVVSDQGDGPDAGPSEEVAAALRLLAAHGHEVEYHHHLPRRGIAEQRAFLLSRAEAPYGLFLDDDVLLEPFVLDALVRTIEEQGCGFVGSALVGLSFLDDVRPHEQRYEPWDGPVRPEVVEPGTPAWERFRLHNAANVWHVQRQLGLGPGDRVPYKVAWVGGCVLYDLAKLREVGGYDFWQDLPPDHVGEDVLAQLRVMAAHGGCGVLPSGAYHQELATTLHRRDVDAPQVLLFGRS